MRTFVGTLNPAGDQQRPAALVAQPGDEAQQFLEFGRQNPNREIVPSGPAGQWARLGQRQAQGYQGPYEGPGGYTDEFGFRHQSFCLSCHGDNEVARLRLASASAATANERFAVDVALTLSPLAELGAAKLASRGRAVAQVVVESASGEAATPSVKGLMDLPEPPQHVRVSKRGDAIYYLDEQGLPVRADAPIVGPHRGRGKGYRPEPVGGREAGHHRGHLVPENAVANPKDVNVPENIISETPASNLGPKKVFENKAAQTAATAPSRTRFISDPIRDPGATVPKAVTHYVTQDGKVVKAETVLNKEK